MTFKWVDVMNEQRASVSPSLVFDIDENTIARITHGDERAFKMLYDRYFTFLCASAMYYVLDADLAKELVNDVFINVWNRKENLAYPIHSYLQTSVRNGCLNHIRSRKARLSMQDGYGLEVFRLQETQLLKQATPFDIYEFKELESMVLAQVESLPAKCKAIFEQYLYLGRSPKEIAQAMGLSVSTVRVQVKIALDRIRTNLSPYVGLLVLLLNQWLQ